MTYEQAIQFISSFTRSGEPVRNLDRIARLLNQVGNPQKKLKFIHIAGTNGKGSVAEYLTNILKHAGYRTGTFTSPYVRHYTDRIRINGQEIPEKILCEFCEGLKGIVDSGAYSQFELTMTIAFLYFVREHVDIVVLETGIGGLLDCTNIIEHPLVSVLTSVSRDHMNILGNTIEEIAQHKAGIIKEGCPVVISPNNKAEQIFRTTAEEKHCALFLPDMQACQAGTISISGNTFRYQGTDYTTKMGGNHQLENALTVLETVRGLKNQNFVISEVAVQQGLSETMVPARIQILQTEPLVILDGGHNADGIGVLTDVLSESGMKSWIGICGMTNSKDADAAAFQLSLVLSKVLCVDGFTKTALPKEQLKNAFIRQHAMASESELEEALPYALKWAKGSHGAVVICGSLYLASWYLNQG